MTQEDQKEFIKKEMTKTHMIGVVLTLEVGDYNHIIKIENDVSC